jgi:HAD superfamily phosphatase
MILPYSGPEVPSVIVVFDIDGVVRDVAHSYRRAIADTVEHYTEGQFRPTIQDIDLLKTEGIWNNDWKASEELIIRFYATQGRSDDFGDRYAEIVDFFQERYRGEQFSGYIKDEPLLMSSTYLQSLTDHQIAWGFFSGATQGSANYVLNQRLGIESPVLVAMEDAPSKPNPEGLFESIGKILHCCDLAPDTQPSIPIIYVGDTVADMQTVKNAAEQDFLRVYHSVGIVPPHAWSHDDYAIPLLQHGARQVFKSVEDLTPDQIRHLIDR